MNSKLHILYQFHCDCLLYTGFETKYDSNAPLNDLAVTNITLVLLIKLCCEMEVLSAYVGEGGML